MERLPISIGILAWNSGQTLVDTLTTYYQNGLIDIANDVTVLFQEFNETDSQIVRHFGLNCIGLSTNVGIGKGFIQLTEFAKTENVLVLEHDWKLTEDDKTTRERLQSGIHLLNNGIDCVRYRHRKNPGYPHFSFQYQGRELDYYDKELECTSPHLLDSVHWLDPADKFPDLIQRRGDYFVTTSRYGNWTNNPCLYKKQFYLDTVSQFAGDGIALEGNISKWWATRKYMVAHGEGLFTHIDLQKHGR